MGKHRERVLRKEKKERDRKEKREQRTRENMRKNKRMRKKRKEKTARVQFNGQTLRGKFVKWCSIHTVIVLIPTH